MAQRHGKEILLCQRAATTQCPFDKEIKSFIKGVFESCFKSFEKNIDTQLEKLEGGKSELKKLIERSGVTRATSSIPSA